MPTDRPETPTTPTRRPWSATAERMARIAEHHADPRVQDYARRWLAAYADGTTGKGTTP